MRPMDTWIHRDRPIKVKGTTSNDASSSHATWRNLDALSWIRQMRLKDVDSPNDVQFEPLIKSNRRIRRLRPNLPIKLKCSSTQKSVLGFLNKLNCLDTTI